MKEVIADLETRCSLKFSYVDQLIDGVAITAQFNNKDLSEALNIIFAKTNISFKLMRQRQIVLYKDDAKKNNPDHHGTIKGIVIDEKTSEPLSYVNVIIDSSSWGTYSNSRGQFSLKQVPFGSYYLRVMDISHEYALFPINVGETFVNLDTIRLSQKIYEGENIVITAEKNNLVINDEKLRLQPSVIVLRRKEINAKPGILEPDL
ncbi:carboxypeptidase-like regulatory domain-containing protein, partial [bacterium]|nr:carboxypeptidase-like regulatory domain-containing protein [bacterium]